MWVIIMCFLIENFGCQMNDTPCAGNHYNGSFPQHGAPVFQYSRIKDPVPYQPDRLVQLVVIPASEPESKVFLLMPRGFEEQEQGCSGASAVNLKKPQKQNLGFRVKPGMTGVSGWTPEANKVGMTGVSGWTPEANKVGMTGVLGLRPAYKEENRSRVSEEKS